MAAAADKIRFSLVSPERALFSGDVDHVVVPGADGQFGVLSRHAPVMSVVASGPVRIIDATGERRFFVGGGVADVSADGLTLLAEDAVDLAKLDPAELARDVQNAREEARDARDDDTRAAAQARLSRLEALAAAIA